MSLAAPRPDSLASPRAPDALAVADAVRVSRSGRPVLKGLSLSLDPGTITILLGPNGAGKTTLLKAFCGSAPLTGGRIAVAGRDPRQDRAARAAIGFVPQEVALYPRLTVLENLQTFAALSGRAGADRGQQIAAALDRTGLGEAGHRLVGQLSGGMQRRANLACALIGRPQLLLLDEPSVGLDLEARLGMGAVLRQLADDTRCAVLLTTHHVAEAESLADKVAVLSDGQIIASGDPGTLVAEHFPAPARRVEAVLTEPAGEALGADLERHGFRPTPDRLVWQSRWSPAPDRALALLEHVGARHGRLREMRVRRPGLEDVYRKLLTDPPEP